MPGDDLAEALADPVEVAEIVAVLERMHGAEHWHWSERADPFEIAVGAILVQRTTWTNAEQALDRLRAAAALHPRGLAILSDDELEELIRPSGQYRTKARKLRAFLDLIARSGSFEVLLALPPAALRGRLLETWGIGEETADAIVLYAAHRPAFVVDAYTRRLFGRLGVGPDPGASYGVWQRFLAAALPRDWRLWAHVHALIVLHAKHLCRARSPKCGECDLRERCPAAGR